MDEKSILGTFVAGFIAGAIATGLVCVITWFTYETQ